MPGNRPFHRRERAEISPGIAGVAPAVRRRVGAHGRVPLRCAVMLRRFLVGATRRVAPTSPFFEEGRCKLFKNLFDREGKRCYIII